MCDILHAGPTATGSGNRYFAKNSDRHPAEPQAFCLIPSRSPGPGILVGETRFNVPDRGFACALSKPEWMAGAEMGINSKGVCIGNTAVFAKTAASAKGVRGMDILRAALCHAETAKEALDFICTFTENNDQGGNGAYRGRLVYSNNYVLADRDSAYILETAGRRWAWKPAEDLDAISNTFTIDLDYKRLDTQTRKEISPVNERAACSDEADPGRKGSKESWKEHVENRFYLRFSRAEARRNGSLKGLASLKGRIDTMGMFGILRSHLDTNPAHPGGAHMESLCVHPAFDPFVRSATTASLVAEYRSGAGPGPGAPSGSSSGSPAGTGNGSIILWFTGTSLPCLSIFKPVILSAGTFIPLWTEYDYAENAGTALECWKRQADRVSRGLGKRSAELSGRRDGIQKRIVDMVAGLGSALGSNPAALASARKSISLAVAEWEKILG